MRERGSEKSREKGGKGGKKRPGSRHKNSKSCLSVGGFICMTAPCE